MSNGWIRQLRTRIARRKLAHVKICAERNVNSRSSAGFEHVRLIHQALPEVNFDKIDTSCSFLGKRLAAPIIISAMTGGFPAAKKINRTLAAAAERVGVGFGLGSQRAMLENKKIAETYAVRDIFSGLLIGNLGLIQFNNNYKMEHLRAAKNMGCDAIALHMNALQEICQAEGDKNWNGCRKTLCRLTRSKIKIIAKETGAGISKETAKALEAAGVAAIDIAGAGGTNFALVEAFRGNDIGNAFADWGIPTVCSLLEVRKAVRVPLICSGGVRSGLDIAKAIALGADVCGIARPLLKPALHNTTAVEKTLQRLIAELKIAMLLTGCQNIAKLRKVKVVLTGFVRDWAEQRL
jgi:isopentenyl-diphosphate delta-isomerase